jgi:hypothetical protein
MTSTTLLEEMQMAESTETIDLRELAKKSKAAFAVGEYKAASLILQQIKEEQPLYTYLQAGDGTIHVVLKEEDGTTDKRRKDRNGVQIVEGNAFEQFESVELK